MPLTVSQACEAFIETLRARSPHTVRTYESALNRFQEYLTYTHQGDPETSRLHPDTLEQFYLWLVEQYGRDKQLTHSTYIAGVRAFFRYLDRHGQGPSGASFERIKSNLQEVMARVSYKAPRPDPGLPLIVVAVNDAADSLPADTEQRLLLLRDRAIINVLYCTGMRREEASRLDRADVDNGRARQAIITGKGNKERVVFFDEDTLRYIREYLAARADAHPPLFIRHGPARGRRKRGRPDYRLSPQSIWQTVKRWSALTGVEATTHDFRHTKASTLLNRGAQLSEVQDLLGHASPETTKKIYAHYEVSHLRDTFDRFSVPAEELAASHNAKRSNSSAQARSHISGQSEPEA